MDLLKQFLEMQDTDCSEAETSSDGLRWALNYFLDEQLLSCSEMQNSLLQSLRPLAYYLKPDESTKMN